MSAPGWSWVAGSSPDLAGGASLLGTMAAPRVGQRREPRGRLDLEPWVFRGLG